MNNTNLENRAKRLDELMQAAKKETGLQIVAKLHPEKLGEAYLMKAQLVVVPIPDWTPSSETEK